MIQILSSLIFLFFYRLLVLSLYGLSTVVVVSVILKVCEQVGAAYGLS